MPGTELSLEDKVMEKMETILPIIEVGVVAGYRQRQQQDSVVSAGDESTGVLCEPLGGAPP